MLNVSLYISHNNSAFFFKSTHITVWAYLLSYIWIYSEKSQMSRFLQALCDWSGYWTFTAPTNATMHVYFPEFDSLVRYVIISLQWHHNDRGGVSDHQPHDCLLNRLFRRRSKKTSKVRVTGLCAGNSPVTGEFPVQRASNAENASIWWRHHEFEWYSGHSGFICQGNNFFYISVLTDTHPRT